MLINNHEAALMLSQTHAKPNKKEILSAFVTNSDINRSRLWNPYFAYNELSKS